MSLDAETAKDFREDIKGQLAELFSIIDKLENSDDLKVANPLLQEFALKIDGVFSACEAMIMMAPGHLGLKKICALSDICKTIGNKAALKNSIALAPIVAGFWFDTMTTIGELLESLENETKTKEIIASFTNSVGERLKILAKYVA
jgi:hypothetical protein